ncbi:MAG: hypothetical protein DWQ02_22965 [Bacteroidetes bacterium]|nr:MAG: hypothetical protein DWQ02_22965 [Bacteroidota bacterium]
MFSKGRPSVINPFGIPASQYNGTWLRKFIFVTVWETGWNNKLKYTILLQSVFCRLKNRLFPGLNYPKTFF